MSESMQMVKSMKLMICDVSRFYCYVFVIRPVYVGLVDEEFASDDESKCDRMNVSMYGIRGIVMN